MVCEKDKITVNMSLSSEEIMRYQFYDKARQIYNDYYAQYNISDKESPLTKK